MPPLGLNISPLISAICPCRYTRRCCGVPIFQSTVEKAYLQWAGPRVADSVRVAVQRLQPARVGWAVGQEERVVFNRRFYMKKGTPLPSPFPGVDCYPLLITPTAAGSFSIKYTIRQRK